MNNLLILLAKEDVRVPQLERLYEVHGADPNLGASALSALRKLDADIAWRASWLLWRLARDSRLDLALLARIIEAAEEATHWIVRLNLCQLFTKTGCPAPLRDRLYPFLSECFADRHVIVRAWALSALVRFADDSEYARSISAMIDEARTDPAKSMQARLRQLRIPPARSRRVERTGS